MELTINCGKIENKIIFFYTFSEINFNVKTLEKIKDEIKDKSVVGGSIPLRRKNGKIVADFVGVKIIAVNSKEGNKIINFDDKNYKGIRKCLIRVPDIIPETKVNFLTESYFSFSYNSAMENNFISMCIKSYFRNFFRNDKIIDKSGYIYVRSAVPSYIVYDNEILFYIDPKNYDAIKNNKHTLEYCHHLQSIIEGKNLGFLYVCNFEDGKRSFTTIKE